MKIEIPQIKDYDDVNRLAIQVHELHVGWRPDLFISVDEVISREYFNELISNKNIFVAKLEEEIVGYIIFNIREKSVTGMRYRKQLNIDAICVDEKRRGNGIGIQILNFIKEVAKENNCTDLYLTVNEENVNAIKIYEKFGMKVKNIAYSMKI